MIPPDEADLLAIPGFLQRDPDAPAPKPKTLPSSRAQRAPLPPQSMVPVLRAIKTGRDTMQKLRQSLRKKYSDRELKRGIDALLRIKSIHRVGRRYLPILQRRLPKPEKNR